MLRYRFQIDLDGVCNAWKSYYLKLASQCCILKVDSPYMQWYYDRLTPWKHFIPVKADLSDLVEKIDWGVANDDKSRKIGESSATFIQSHDFIKESEQVATLIREIASCQRSGA
jgi:hypothetical protein